MLRLFFMPFGCGYKNQVFPFKILSVFRYDTLFVINKGTNDLFKNSIYRL